MSVSTAFAKNIPLQRDLADASASPRMSDKTMTHLFAQVRHIQARMTARTQVSELRKMCEMRAMDPKFLEVLFVAVMQEWAYLNVMRLETALREMPDMSERIRMDAESALSMYEQMVSEYDAEYEKLVSSYNA